MINNKLFLPYKYDSNFKNQLHFLLPALKLSKCLKTSTIRELKETSQNRKSSQFLSKIFYARTDVTHFIKVF